MSTEVLRRWRSRRWVGLPIADVVLAVALLVAGEVGIGVGAIAEGPALLTVPVAALMTLPLGWRRSAPVAMVAVSGGAVMVQALLAHPATSLFSFVTLLVLAFSLGSYARGRTLRVGVVILLGTVWTSQVLDPGSSGLEQALTPPILVGAPLLAGLLLARQRHQSTRLGELVTELDRARERTAHTAALEERARTARELHDIVAHSLSVMILQTGAAEALIPTDPDQASRAVDAVAETGRQAVAEMRRLLGVLREGDDETLPATAPTPGLADLAPLVEQARAAGTPLDVSVRGAPVALPAGLDLTAYRVLQEALTNARKHAGLVSVRLAVRYAPEQLELDVVNTGPSVPDIAPHADPDIAPDIHRDGEPGAEDSADRSGRAGHGLTGMRERVALYGGRIRTGPQAHGGYAVHVWLPVP